jgi:hypothetical protein
MTVMRSLFIFIAIALGAGFIFGIYLAVKNRRRTAVGTGAAHLPEMREKEDIDAYNGDDQQPPLEPQNPRQRSLAE